MENSGYGSHNFTGLVQRFRLQRGFLFGVLIIAALLAFEIFNYTTTDYALSDLLGGLEFVGVRWATILAIAFCGIDFAGIARLFTPEQGTEEPAEVWYLFGAWMLAATMNAMLTWWGVSLAILNHQTLGNAVVDRTTLLKVVPIFVAVMVWLIRVLIIGTFSVAGERLFSQGNRKVAPVRSIQQRVNRPAGRPAMPPISRPVQTSIPANSSAFRPSNRNTRNIDQPTNQTDRERPAPTFNRPEPTYHPMSMSPKSKDTQTRR